MCVRVRVGNVRSRFADIILRGFCVDVEMCGASGTKHLCDIWLSFFACVCGKPFV